MKQLLCRLGIHRWERHWVPVSLNGPFTGPVLRCSYCERVS